MTPIEHSCKCLFRQRVPLWCHASGVELVFVFPRWCTIHAVTFLFLAENMRSLLKKSTQHKDLQSTRRSGHHLAETCVTQPSTSFVEEWDPSTPPVAGPSKRLCKGFGCCTQHAQQWIHAARTLPCRATGASRALAVAKMDRNVALWTISHRLLCPRRPGRPCRALRTVPGIFWPSALWQHPKPFH